MDNPILIQNKIYEIRGQRVILDRDLAQLYGVETKNLNKAVRRNIKRFEGEDFMFQLTKDECLRFQIGTLNGERGKHLKYMPLAFTEQGVAMLSSVLRSETAIEINRQIMRAFVAVRQMLYVSTSVSEEIKELKRKVLELDNNLEETLAAVNDLSEDTRNELDSIYAALAELSRRRNSQTEQRNKIGFKK